MRDIRPFEHHRFGRKLVQIGRANLHTAVASKRIGALLVRQKQDQIWLVWCSHNFCLPTKSVLTMPCNDSTVAVAIWATHTLPTRSGCTSCLKRASVRFQI